MNLTPIQDYINDNTTWVTGVDLFSYSMPHDLDRGVLVITDGTGNRPDHEVPGIFVARFQVIIRNPDILEGMQQANALYDLLNLLNTDLIDYHVEYSRPRHTPISYPRSPGSVIEWSINYDIRYRTA